MMFAEVTPAGWSIVIRMNEPMRGKLQVFLMRPIEQAIAYFSRMLPTTRCRRGGPVCPLSSPDDGRGPGGRLLGDRRGEDHRL